MSKFNHLLLVFLGLLTLVSAARNGLIGGRKRRLQNIYKNKNLLAKPTNGIQRPVVDVDGKPIPDYDVIYTFDQLIDHKKPSAGTFKQRYYHTWEYYRPGGPIVLMTPGEQSMDGSSKLLTNASMPGVIARSTNGAVIILEHRFYGKSTPFPDLSVESLRVHTIEQAMEDLVYFAKNVALPMPGGRTDAIRPEKTPWILVGGSYAGALTSWTLNMKPDVFWAGYSSSGVIQPLLDFWQYFAPIQKHMPANCSADVQAVIEHVDTVLASGDQAAYNELQTSFGFADLAPSDFANALAFPITEWQVLDVASKGGSSFYDFCDALEVQRGEVAPASGWGLEVALSAWARYYRTGYLDDLCGEFAPDECVKFDGSTSASTDLNDDRAWMWQVCSEVGWAQVGPPSNVRGIMSKFFTVQNYTSYCNDAFLGAFGSTFESRVDSTSKTYLGWKTKADRLFVVNGERDPWLEVTHSAEEARIASTASTPIFLTDGFHCSDILSANMISPSIGDVFTTAQTTFPQWVSEFKPGASSEKRGNSASRMQVSVQGALAVVAGVLLGVVAL